MAARVCDTCEINWPNTTPDFSDCPVCMESTRVAYGEKPDVGAKEAQAYARQARARLEAQRATPSPAHANRVERYLALGFSEVDAQLLALATWVHRDTIGRKWERAVNHLDVRKALERGCTHELAVEIFG